MTRNALDLTSPDIIKVFGNCYRLAHSPIDKRNLLRQDIFYETGP
jgi:hypothetical protein